VDSIWVDSPHERRPKVITRVVDNKTFVLGLDQLYRRHMKQRESRELLDCARETIAVLGVEPLNVPVEGYYYETPELTEYFKTIKAIQGVDRAREAEVAHLDSYQRLNQVTESRIFGVPRTGNTLLHNAVDSLTVAMEQTRPWKIDTLTEQADRVARQMNDYSMVAIASVTRDPVNLAALRESVVLYATLSSGCAIPQPVVYNYVCQVDSVVLRKAEDFIFTFNTLFGAGLLPDITDLESFYIAGYNADIDGRCVRIGYEGPYSYHWAIDDGVVKDFWDDRLWTTQAFREAQKIGRFYANL